MQGAAEDRCARRVSEAVVDRKGLPMRCLRASRPTKGADAEGLFHCTLHLRAFSALAREASRRPGGERSGPGRRILFFCTSALQLPQKALR